MKISNLNDQFRSKLDVNLNRNIIEHQHLTLTKVDRDLNYLIIQIVFTSHHSY